MTRCDAGEAQQRVNLYYSFQSELALEQNRLAGDGDLFVFAVDRGDVGYRLGARGADPARGEPGAGDGELRPAAVEAHLDVGGGRHRGVAQGTLNVAVQADLRWKSRDFS